MPAGGRGYTRPASLVSLWSTAPFLLNNSVGQFDPSPSVEARMSVVPGLDRADAVAGEARQGSGARRQDRRRRRSTAPRRRAICGAGRLSCPTRCGRCSSRWPAIAARGCSATTASSRSGRSRRARRSACWPTSTCCGRRTCRPASTTAGWRSHRQASCDLHGDAARARPTSKARTSSRTRPSWTRCSSSASARTSSSTAATTSAPISGRGAGAERRRQARADRVPEDVLTDRRDRSWGRLGAWLAGRDASEPPSVGAAGTAAPSVRRASRRAPNSTPSTSSSARAPAAAPSRRGWPRPASACCCSRPAAIRDSSTAATPPDPACNACPTTTTCRRFTRFATENDAMRWDFFVRHYADDATQRRDPKYCATIDGKPADGVLYPRAGTLGGCTAHNAMILVYPHNADWDQHRRSDRRSVVARRAMRGYFERLENCRHRPLERCAEPSSGSIRARHGWAGWLQTEKAIPEAALARPRSASTILSTRRRTRSRDAGRPLGDADRARSKSRPIPTTGALVAESADRPALHAADDRESRSASARASGCSTSQRRYPGPAEVELDALATRVLFDDSNRAIGVEYLKGDAALPRARQAERARRASCSRRARRARSSSPAARSTRRSC